VSIRTRRLKRDEEKLVSELGTSEHVTLKAVSGDPTDHYQVIYHVNGIMWDDSAGTASPTTDHVVDIYLPPGYPKQPPRCIMRTPIWHPNIGDYVCIGDFWSAGVTLADIVAHIGEMIQYMSYNLRSPVNKSAAQWEQRNQSAFPIGNKNIRPPDSEEEQSTAVQIERPGDDVEITLGPIRDRE